MLCMSSMHVNKSYRVGVDMPVSVGLYGTVCVCVCVCVLMEYDFRVNSFTALECNLSIALENECTSSMKCMF